MLTKRAFLLFSVVPAIGVACGGEVTPSPSSNVIPASDGAQAPSPPNQEESAAASSSTSSSTSKKEGGTHRDESTSSSGCNLTSVPATQKVTFHLTNQGSSTRWIATDGNFCGTIDVARGGTSLPQLQGFQCLCECPNPGASRASGYAKLDPGESMDIPWLAQAIEVCTESYDCSQHGWPGGPVTHRVTTATKPVSAGPLTVRFAVETTLPQGCTEGTSDAFCDTRGGWNPTTMPASPAMFCGGTSTASVDFDLPPSGDVNVDVAIP